MILDMAMHGQNGPVRIKDIAARQGVSVKYLEKLVRELKDAGFVRSRRGPRGGHELDKPLAEISVGDIVRALEGDLSLVECNGEGGPCPRTAECLTRGVWMEAARAMHEKLDSITLADLIAGRTDCAAAGTAPDKPLPGSGGAQGCRRSI
ncbi:Hmc operon transcriptional regulator Rrf2 [Desulfovibrio sp. TomC]|nr:Hmc operon transcriptional regulator Rrf2 [Desulfovibrio sp. TomC]